MSLWIKSYSVTIQMKATEQYFSVVLFIMLYKVVLTFESVDKILKCGHSKKLLSSTFLWCCFLLYKLRMVPVTFKSVAKLKRINKFKFQS